MKKFDFNTVLPEGRYKGKTVEEVFQNNKKSIFSLIKQYGYSFSDDVLKEAGIKKIIRDREAHWEIERDIKKGKQEKKLKKDTKNIEQILDELEESRNQSLKRKEREEKDDQEKETDENTNEDDNE